ncbi:ubiquitin-related domain-containing protein [Ilyonectria robusta]|uniref:ubiquitin-related domain-containing protein n=1 Tax=Ilyonectria robusta TaxID=1079257 RepID=UPI001E8CB971|nr:ubiquitin-related domain-containing protein [Ilyonectria robusta]KAH8659583.1 ubiquitin-related domain-containing protein [Ilyonectria robusta]
MFYQGTLQDGISTAVGQQKLVLCFVTDESEESTQWENEFLLDESLSKLIKDQSVALRLTAGSDEAGYLAQIFPLPRTPTVVIIQNGELKEYITPGTTKEDFFRRIQNAFSATSSSAPVSASTSTPQPEPAPAASSSQGVSPSGESSTSENVRRILTERAAKLKTQKEEAERKAKEQAKEERNKAKAKGKADAEAGAKTDNAVAHKAAEAVKKKRQEQQEERRRILKRIEDDKAERRLRAQAREQMRTEDVKGGDVASSLVNAPESKLPSTTKASGMTSLQVRMFDGSTLRSRFKTTSPLKTIRSWVDENRTDGSQPYTFKQVLTPSPNKTIDETEENKSVGELGLSPSSTLVLIPVKNFTSAYDASSQNIVSRFFAFILGIFSWFFGLFSSGDARAPAGAGEDSAGSSQDQSRIQSFGNQNDRQRDQQLYNGNSLNFEPRPDEEEKDD